MTKLQQLIEWFNGKGRVLVALSGGVDSALVAYAAQKALGEFSVAATADYKTLAQEELESAKRICAEIGIKHINIEYDELDNHDFIKNDRSRCFHCRTELAKHILNVSRAENLSLIVDGTNLDELREYRPGITALKSLGIQSPLVEVGLIKSDVRRCAKEAGLSIYDKPSNSCLASRIPWGFTVTAEKLKRIERSETLVKQLFGVRQVRVRDLGKYVKIEVSNTEIHLLNTNMEVLLTQPFRMQGKELRI